MQIEAASKIFRERPLWTVILLCLGVRFAEHAWFGVSFDMQPFQWQLLDVARLRDHPWQSLYLMHMQPPLFNGLLALALPSAIGAVESYFLYAHLEAALLLAAMFFASRYLSDHGLAALVGLAATLVALALLKTLFHVAWVAVTLLVVCGLVAEPMLYLAVIQGLTIVGRMARSRLRH